MSALVLTAAQKTVLDAADTLLDQQFASGTNNPDTSQNAPAVTGYATQLSSTQQIAVRAAFRQALGALVGQMEDWHLIGGVGQPAFQNAWVNFGAPYAMAGFQKDPFGLVSLKGKIQSGTSPATVFTLPVGYRPTETRTFICMSHTGTQDDTAHIEIDTSGNVSIQSSGKTWVSLDNVRFRTY